VSARPRILVVSFSPIARDARVMRHVTVLARLGDVVTCGYGAAPEGVAEHVEVPERLPSLPQTPAGVALLAARRHRAADFAAPAVRHARRALEGRRFDLVVGNDARALPVAHAAAGTAPVWADMHEWAPEERTQVLSWRLLVRPFADDLCRRYLPRSAAVTTVNDSIAGLYRERYGVAAEVVRNAAPFVPLTPSPVADDRIRLVHSGGAVPGRNIEALVDAALALDERFTLDLYLVPGGDGGRYLTVLRQRAGGSDRVRFHEPVKPSDLPATLNPYDVGIYSIPPITVNTRLALPNKLFDFVQGRLAVVIGPSEEMARVVRSHGLGAVADDFSAEALARTLRSLTPQQVREHKARADEAARELSSERDEATVTRLATRLLGRPA
jgi:glycosyltransferase involved in cell wall biosynthesis